MVSPQKQINQLRTHFETLPSDKKQVFIRNLIQKLTGNKDIEYIKFLKDCISDYVSNDSNQDASIATFEDYDTKKRGKPWVGIVTGNTNLFQTHEGEPIGFYTGDTKKGEGGIMYVINPLEGRIYGYGQKNKEDKTKSLIVYAKYHNGVFLSCDRQGKEMLMLK